MAQLDRASDYGSEGWGSNPSGRAKILLAGGSWLFLYCKL